MRKFIFALPIIIFALSTGCATVPADESITNEEKPTDNKYSNEYTYENYQPPDYKPPEYTLYENNPPLCEDPPQEDPPCECSGLSEYERAQLRVWTVEELGEIIVASGNFWNDWWYERDRFTSYHQGYWGKVPEHLLIGYVELLPTSGFENLSDIRDYLMHFYTAAWVDTLLVDELPPFTEYNNVLYIHAARINTGRFDWNMATHTLINQAGCHAYVETTIWYFYRDSSGDMLTFETSHRFTFINGRINRTSRCPVSEEMLYSF